ncbi:hypothetical protein SAMN05421688_3195 [Poseidonocella pacifica]|uniref:Uncharacterized protein n=1 Tax=Poseidonocella pacifica TaxID=871651 RepID=A0A1I0YK83_9RHOB|nr:hypothetical protein [Poseidonocella pacifica]SFB13601.1 hypothetical protein SAMN05421688_3195 [Poseidonocella pacifica]
MSLQLLCRFEAGNAASWQSAYDEKSEERGNAGLSQLQIWTGADTGSAIWVLFAVNDRGKAQKWLDGPARLSDGQIAEAHFLKTA